MENDTSNINDNFNDLKPYQQKILVRFLNDFTEINAIDFESISSVGMTCRKCGSSKFFKNGKTEGVQRYQCKDCHCTQFSDANTPLYNLKLKKKWIDFVYIMLEKEQPYSCANISEELEIHVKTVHAWRHKLLSSFNTVNPIEIKEEAELDEVYLPFTVKGLVGKEKFDKFIKPGHKDNVASKLRIDEELMEAEKYQTIFMCIHNRMSDFDFIPIKIQKKGIVSEADIKRIMGEIDLKEKTVITDSEPSMLAFLRNVTNVNHLTFKSSDVKQGIMEDKNIHNNNINNTMMLFKEWIKKFHGISTKYIWNYLKWFRFIKLFELFKIDKIVKSSLSDKKSYPRYKNIFSDYVKFVYA